MTQLIAAQGETYLHGGRLLAMVLFSDQKS